MKPPRGRRAAAASAALGLAVAAAAAGVLREDLCVPYYLRQLDSKDESDRLSAAKRLGEIRSAWAVPRLVSLLRIQRFDSPQAKVYGEALERILRDPDHRLHGPCSMALGRIGAAPTLAVPALIEALGDEENWCRSQAMKALGMFGAGAKEAVPALIEVLAAPKKDDTTLLLVLPLLAEIGPEARAAVPAIREVMMNHESKAEPVPHPFAALRKHDVAEAAREALWRIGGGVGKESR